MKNIVYEDGDILIINKEAGINVHPWDHKTKETNIIAQIHDYFWNKLSSLTFKPSLVHRIDRDTSWILLIAKKKDILTKLAEDFNKHTKLKKIYYAFVFWKLSDKIGTIDKKLLRIEWAKNENKVQVSNLWQEALTKYRVLQEYIIQTTSWENIISEVEVEIFTGRMHQIRVHFSSIGNPIVWDNTYGNKSFNAYIAKNYWLCRQALHAWKIEFFHPWKGKIQKNEALIKQDLREFKEKILK
jgi:RluA family pseudouridine synthase